MNTRIEQLFKENQRIAKDRLIAKLNTSFFKIKKLNKIFAYFDVVKKEFLAVSSSVENILGYTPEEMEGKDYEKFLAYHGDIERGEKAIERNMAETENIIGFVNSYTHKNGAEIYLNWDCSLIEDDITFCIAQLATPEQVLFHQKIRTQDEKENQST